MELSQLLYFLLVFISTILLYIVAYFLYSKYRQVSNEKTLYLARAFLIFGVGATLLIIEQTILTLTYTSASEIVLGSLEETLARLIVSLAIFAVAFGLWYLNKFSIDFLDVKFEKLIFVIGPLAFAHAVLYFIFPYNWYLKDEIWEFAHNVEAWHNILLIILYLTPVWFSPVVLLYATYKIRNENRLGLIRSSTISVGLIIGALGYSIQVVAPSIISGLCFFLMPLVLYVGLIMPEWYKNIMKVNS